MKEAADTVSHGTTLLPPLRPGNVRVFISYRRDDSADICGRINDHLATVLGVDFVLEYVEAIAPGADFRDKSLNAVRQSDVLLAVIGPEWRAEVRRPNMTRLDEESDLVKTEIEEALTHNVRIVPVLVRGAKMPSAQDMPPSLKALAARNAVEVRSNKFRADMEVLMRAISVIGKKSC